MKKRRDVALAWLQKTMAFFMPSARSGSDGATRQRFSWDSRPDFTKFCVVTVETSGRGAGNFDADRIVAGTVR